MSHYLRNHPPATMHNRAMLMWASTYVDGLMTDADRRQTIDDLFALEQADGGWGLATPGDWKRCDDKQQDRNST